MPQVASETPVAGLLCGAFCVGMLRIKQRGQLDADVGLAHLVGFGGATGLLVHVAAGNFVRSRHWIFVGIDTAPTVAGYACEVLLRQCARARLAHIAKQPRNCKPITKTTRGDAFATGWVAGASEMVEAFAAPAGDKALLLSYIEREHGELQKGKVRNTLAGRKTDVGHIASGYRAGQSAQLHRGVGGMPAQGLLS